MHPLLTSKSLLSTNHNIKTSQKRNFQKYLATTFLPSLESTEASSLANTGLYPTAMPQLGLQGFSAQPTKRFTSKALDR